MQSLAEKMHSYLLKLNQKSDVYVEHNDDREVIAKLENMKLITRNIAGCRLTDLGKVAIEDLNKLLEFYRQLSLQAPHGNLHSQNNKSGEVP